MNKLYTILISAAALLMATGVSAMPRFGAKRAMEVSAGYSYNLTSHEVGGIEGLNRLQGAYVSFTYDFDLLKEKWGSLQLEPGVKLSYVLESDAEDNFAILTKHALKESYLDVPVNVKYSYKLNYVTVSAFAGPVFSLGLTSTTWDCYEKYMVKTFNYSGKQEIKGARPSEIVTNAISDYSRFDLKFGFGLGFTFMDRASLRLSYNLGLLNRYNGENTTDLTVSRHTNVFNVGLGYRF